MSKDVILCIDDEKILLSSLKEEIIRSFGYKYEIIMAENPFEALGIVKELMSESRRLPIVIADYVMPNMKGDELLINIHKISPSTLKVLLTGQASLDGVINAINNASLFKFVEKPWQMKELKEIIDEAVLLYSAVKPTLFEEIQEPLIKVKSKIDLIGKSLTDLSSNECADEKCLYEQSILELDEIIQSLGLNKIKKEDETL